MSSTKMTTMLGLVGAAAPVSAVARTPDNLDLFITGNDGRVYTSWWVAGSDWSGLAARMEEAAQHAGPGRPRVTRAMVNLGMALKNRKCNDLSIWAG